MDLLKWRYSFSISFWILLTFPMRWSTFSSFIFIDQADIILGLEGWFSLLHGPLTGVRGIHICIRFFFPSLGRCMKTV